MPGARGARAGDVTRRDATVAVAAGTAPTSPERGGGGGGREHRGARQTQPAPPAARTADRLRSGPRGRAPRRGGGGAAWRDEVGGAPAGRPRRRPAPPPPPPTQRAAHNLGGSGAGPRAPGSRSEAGRRALARSLAPADGGRGRRGSGRGTANPPPRPPAGSGAVRCGHGGRPATAGRGTRRPGARGERVGAGRGGGGRKAVPHLTQHATTSADGRTGGGGGGPRSGAAAGPGGETHRDAARGSADATDEAERRKGERADGARLARPPSRRRDDDVTEAVGGRGRGRTPPRGCPFLRARTRVGHRGTTRGLTARGLQRRGGPAAPRTPTGLSSAPPRVPPRGARDLPPPNTHEPRPARDNTLPARAHRSAPPRGPPTTHTHTHPSAAAPDFSASGTVSSPPGDAARRPRRPWRGGATPSRGRGRLGPRRWKGDAVRPGGVGWGGPGEGAAAASTATGRGRHAHTARAAGQGRGAPAQGGKVPRHDRATRKTSAGSHRHTHEGGPTTPETPAGPSHPGASHDPAPPPGPACDGPPAYRGGTPSVQPSSNPSVLARSAVVRVRPPGPAPRVNAPERGGPHRARNTATGCRLAARAGATGSSRLRD